MSSKMVDNGFLLAGRFSFDIRIGVGFGLFFLRGHIDL
jgi:hypothetical protein